jgi:hypothetical protein
MRVRLDVGNFLIFETLGPIYIVGDICVVCAPEIQ